MAVTDKFGHEADGSRPWERARKHKYDLGSVTENIATEPAFAVDTPAQLAALFTQGWNRSAGHRRNMLDPNVLEIGVGVAVSEDVGPLLRRADVRSPQIRHDQVRDRKRHG